MDGRAETGAEYRAWKRAYQNARQLRDYLFENWRSDPNFYDGAYAPHLGDMFEVIMVNA